MNTGDFILKALREQKRHRSAVEMIADHKYCQYPVGFGALSKDIDCIGIGLSNKGLDRIGIGFAHKGVERMGIGAMGKSIAASLPRNLLHDLSKNLLPKSSASFLHEILRSFPPNVAELKKKPEDNFKVVHPEIIYKCPDECQEDRILPFDKKIRAFKPKGRIGF
jgi:hypothetical protein